MLTMYLRQLFFKVMDSVQNESFSTLLVFLSVLIIVKTVMDVKDRMSLPPGPWGIPIFGYLPFLNGDSRLQYIDLSKNYGSIFSARLGTQLVVVLSDYRLIREAFRQDVFSGRPNTEFSSMLGNYGIINTEGNLWKNQRKFLLDKLRSFGMSFMSSGKKLMQPRIELEVKDFIDTLLANKGEPTNVSPLLATSISNVICSIIMSVRFNHGDLKFKRFMDLIEEGFKLFGSILNVNYIPVLRYTPRQREVRDKIKKNCDEMGKFFQEKIEHHRQTFNENAIRDLIDYYLWEINKAKTEGREGQLFEGRDHDRQIQQILGDLFSAGMETVKTTLEWAIIFMLHYPEAAKAVQEELDAVVGKTRMPDLSDLEFLPITEATILEILRKSSIVPLGTTHATKKDVMLNGYNIPAGSQVVPLLYAVHMDPNTWDQPEEFRPARFLSPEGKVTKPESFMPFGVGRRTCLGEALARMEIYEFFICMLHMFDLRLPEGAPLPSLRGNTGVTVTPDPFKVCFVQRNFEILDFNVANEQNGPLRNVGAV